MVTLTRMPNFEAVSVGFKAKIHITCNTLQPGLVSGFLQYFAQITILLLFTRSVCKLVRIPILCVKEIIRFFQNHLLGHTSYQILPKCFVSTFFCVLLQVGGVCTEDMNWSPLHVIGRYLNLLHCYIDL